MSDINPPPKNNPPNSLSSPAFPPSSRLPTAGGRPVLGFLLPCFSVIPIREGTVATEVTTHPRVFL
jgi:hypothetical protein